MVGNISFAIIFCNFSTNNKLLHTFRIQIIFRNILFNFPPIFKPQCIRNIFEFAKALQSTSTFQCRIDYYLYMHLLSPAGIALVDPCIYSKHMSQQKQPLIFNSMNYICLIMLQISYAKCSAAYAQHHKAFAGYTRIS